LLHILKLFKKIHEWLEVWLVLSPGFSGPRSRMNVVQRGCVSGVASREGAWSLLWPLLLVSGKVPSLELEW
jgi:hypothetical protein